MFNTVINNKRYVRDKINIDVYIIITLIMLLAFKSFFFIVTQVL